MQNFKDSIYYSEIINKIDEEMKKAKDEVALLNYADLSKVFMLPKKERNLKIEEMSKRENILSIVLDILQNFKDSL